MKKIRTAIYVLTGFLSTVASVQTEAKDSNVLSSSISNNMEGIVIPSTISNKVLEVFQDITQKKNILEESSNQYLIYNMMTEYWKKTDTNFINFHTSIRKIIEKNYQNTDSFNASNQMLLDIGLTPDRLEAIYPHARKQLVEKFGHQGDNPKSLEELETYFPEKYTPFLSPDQVLMIGMFACQGDNEELSKDMLNFANIFVREDLVKYGTVKYKFGKMLRPIQFTITNKGISNIHFEDGMDKVPDSIQNALTNIIPAQNPINTQVVYKKSHQQKSTTKQTLLTQISNLGIDLNNKQSQKTIAQLLAKKDLNSIKKYAESFDIEDTDSLAMYMTELVLKYKPDFMEKKCNNSDDEKEDNNAKIENSDTDNETLFQKLLQSKANLDLATSMKLIPDQYGMGARFKELKKAQSTGDVIAIVNKIAKRNPEMDKFLLFESMVQYHKAHKAWYLDKYKGKKAESPFNRIAHSTAQKTREEIGTNLAV